MRHYLTILLALTVSLFALSAPVDAQCIVNAPGFTLDKGFDTTAIEGPADWHEPDWSEWIAQQLQLDPDEVCEVRTYDGSKVDVLTRCEAVEVEWAKKWKEAPGQALLYSVQTHRHPAVILLSHGDEDDIYIQRCQAVCLKAGIRMYVQRVPKPTENRIAPKPVGPKQATTPQSAAVMCCSYRLVI